MNHYFKYWIFYVYIFTCTEYWHPIFPCIWLFDKIGRTYRIRVHNVGISTCLNFRIQNHNMLLVETEGSYTIQQNYTNMDIHVGQSYSFLVTMNQSPLNDFYVVASGRFVGDANIRDKATGVAVLHYTNSQGPVIGPLPNGPDEDMYISMTQAKSVR